MAKGVKDDNREWRLFLQALPALKHIAVTAGIQSDAGFQKDKETPIAEYALYNELGTKRIPARPFVSSTSDEQRQNWLEFMDKGINKVFEGKVTPQVVFGRLGLKMVADIKQKIDSIYEPPNAPSTIKRKGSTKPLIDSGSMKRAIRHEVQT